MNKLRDPLAPSRTADKFVLRLPDGMRERVAEAAKGSHRSMNSEIISRLELSLESPKSMPLMQPSGELTSDEQRLIARFRMLDLKQQSALVVLIDPTAQPGRFAEAS
ncbi:Arc family DNA-binding protein [Pseudomonas sp. NY15437]|uniref:Arc family DNA-binding protein n=1 Tax=Pseudomonas sp. NY15437 TaxID=3400360 RepID=UPI003A847A30